MRYTIRTKLMIAFTSAGLLLGLNGQLWYGFAERLHDRPPGDAAFESELLRLLGITVGCFALIIGIGLLTSRLVARPAARIVERVEIMALGDLQGSELRLTQRDEWGEAAKAVNHMGRNLRGLIRRVTDSSAELIAGVDRLNETAETTVRAAKQIGEATRSISIGSEKQVDRAADAASSFQDIDHGLRRIAEYAEDVNGSASNAVKEAEAGDAVIARNVEQMRTIQLAFGHSGDIVRKLGERSREIGEFVSTIRAIAETTNLLALNASIEAARAGEHGLGFSVVASEVKKLAAEAKLASDRIAALIDSVRSEVRLAIETMRDSGEEVQTGMNLMAEASRSFRQIVHAVYDVSQRGRQVRVITEDATAQSERLAAMTAELEFIAKLAWASSVEAANFSSEQAAAMEGLFQAAETLQSMSREMNELVQRFKI
ncbi:methyl-accepting chemotaxis protein [Paenibacillus glycinis]|uniref:Methyl-accepting chemotaxis protein n=1 Tax=Paenibacillus glycinis TaxID=2697035 RepID=A0ABW9XRE5_9BACL|nr:methyl-accepting chemotaxis protein [Paenibacillus glycinis]NBD25219.1 hypothetical protein [Paenibacillus glycinis]